MNGKYIVFFLLLVLTLTALFLPSAHTAFFAQNSSPHIVIDAGHGGIDGGAVGNSGVEEAKLNLAIAKKTRAIFGLLGYETLMTRVNDGYAYEDGNTIREKKISDTKARVEMINDTENAYLVSIHLNHFSQAQYFGAQTFYTKDSKVKSIAEQIQEALRLGTDINNKREAKEVGKNIYLLNNINCPGILVECGFLSNPREEALLQTEDYQKKIALSIALGFADGHKEVEKYEN